MTLSEHARRTEKLFDLRAEDIHRWIDGLFDDERFNEYLRIGKSPGFDPYDHRIYRHCAEALEDAYREFGDRYTREQIKAVFENHIMDDYDGYIPSREDFSSEAFREKYHEGHMQPDREEVFSKSEFSDYFQEKPYSFYRKEFKSESTGFRFRIVLPTLAAVALFASSLFIVILPFFRNSMLENKQELIKELTSEVESLIRYYIDLEQSGELSGEEARETAKDEISKIRYGESGKDYFWITDMHPRMLMHPYRPDLIGTDLTDYRDREDRSGKLLFVEFVELVKENNEGYLRYLWQWMDDPDKTALKLSYVRGIPEWDWIIGTGIYINDVEEEAKLLIRNILVVFGIITVLLILLLSNILIQSRNIEEKRRRAEAGLNEARARYRALVETSKEGYILEVGGEIVYSNRILQLMLDYTGEDLSKMRIWDLLDPEKAGNEFGIRHLRNLVENKTGPEEFEGQVKTRRGTTIDSIISTNRTFFTEKNGHVISIRPIRHQRETALIGNLLEETGTVDSPPALIREIETSETTGHVVQTLNQLPLVVKDLLDRGIHPALLREIIGRIFDTSIVRCIELSLKDLGPPPVKFSYLTLGSNARHEMTLFSDQDNALVFEDAEKTSLKKTRNYFLRLAESVSSKLNQAGYKYCSGGIMAANPRWCLSQSEWNHRFSHWITVPDDEAMMGFKVFYDFRNVYGSKDIVDQLFLDIRKLIEKNPLFLVHFARDALEYRVPLDMFGRVRGKKSAGIEYINIKECIKPIEVYARTYSIKHGILTPETRKRLGELREAGFLNDNKLRELVYIFNFLWDLRFRNQLRAHAELKRVNDDLVLSELTNTERQHLEDALSEIQSLKSNLSFDFLGNVLL